MMSNALPCHSSSALSSLRFSLQKSCHVFEASESLWHNEMIHEMIHERIQRDIRPQISIYEGATRMAAKKFCTSICILGFF